MRIWYVKFSVCMEVHAPDDMTDEDKIAACAAKILKDGKDYIQFDEHAASVNRGYSYQPTLEDEDWNKYGDFAKYPVIGYPEENGRGS